MPLLMGENLREISQGLILTSVASREGGSGSATSLSYRITEWQRWKVPESSNQVFNFLKDKDLEPLFKKRQMNKQEYKQANKKMNK